VKYGDGTAESFAYDILGRLVSATNAIGTVAFSRDASGRTLREAFGDAWVETARDSLGRGVQMRSSMGASETIRRDVMGEVTSVALRSGWSAHFDRDEVGAETKRQLPGGVETRTSWDEAGRPRGLVLRRQGDVLAETQYGWTGLDTLQSKSDAVGGGGEDYLHDARGRLGRRVAKRTADRTTKWLWNGNVPVHEWVEGAQGAAAEGGDELTTWLFEPESFAPMAKVVRRGATTKAYSIVSDYLGTPREMVDEAGKVAWKAQLDVYGVAKVEEGSAADCPWRWPGQYEDEETGLYYNRFRYYDPQRGGYLSQDPIRLGGGRGCSATYPTLSRRPTSSAWRAMTQAARELRRRTRVRKLTTSGRWPENPERTLKRTWRSRATLPFRPTAAGRSGRRLARTETPPPFAWIRQ
jgi:RHS repeat-associated protein